MPLITLAWLAVAAGLLLGFGGDAFAGALVALGGLVAGMVRRSAVWAALGVLVGCGWVAAATARRADAHCARSLVATGTATVRLSEDAGPRSAARGFAESPGCRVRTRVRLASGSAAAGSMVRVRGRASRLGDGVTLSGGAAVLIERPGLLARWRSRAGRTIDRLYGAQAPLARALLIADERDIDPEVRRRFADAGIIHMISVSGLHVAVLAEAVVLVLLMAGTSIRRAEGIAVVVVAFFVAFVGAPAPAIRSGAMFAALVATRRLQRPTSPWAVLALGGLVPLAEPRAAASIGYQLSIVGMAGLLAAAGLTRRLPASGAPPWVARLGRETLATVVASLATAPIVAWHFGRVSLAAPITNLAAAPLFSLAQPALFLSLLIAPLEPLARLVADGTGVLLAAIGWVGDVGAALPGAAVQVTPTAATAALSAAAAAAFLVSCTAYHWVRPALVAAAALALMAWWPLLPAVGGRLEIHMLDVGQGDAIALRTPRARWIVMDAGNAWATGDAGARVVLPHLRRRGGEVAALILSHPHADHVGGAATLVRGLRVGLVLDGGFIHPGEAYAGVITSARERRVPWRLARAGDSLVIDGVRLLILAPDSARAATASEANEASVMVMAEWRGVRLLLTGDAERNEEERVRRRYPDRLRADILKVGHHGSGTSSGDAFLDAVRPRVALVSVGAGNAYGHPNTAVMESLAARGVEIFRTDEDGTTVVSTDGSSFWIRTDERRWVLRAASR